MFHHRNGMSIQLAKFTQHPSITAVVTVRFTRHLPSLIQPHRLLDPPGDPVQYPIDRVPQRHAAVVATTVRAFDSWLHRLALLTIVAVVARP